MSRCGVEVNSLRRAGRVSLVESSRVSLIVAAFLGGMIAMFYRAVIGGSERRERASRKVE